MNRKGLGYLDVYQSRLEGWETKKTLVQWMGRGLEREPDFLCLFEELLCSLKLGGSVDNVLRLGRTLIQVSLMKGQ